MAEAKAREGLKLKPIWCLYCPKLIIPVTYIVGSDILKNKPIERGRGYIRMAEAKAREGLKFKPIWCLY